MMANFDRQLQVLSAELVTAMEAALGELAQGGDPIVLLRHAGVEQYQSRRYRTPEIQQIESAMHGLERIHAKLGIPREGTILSVFDRYAELHAEPMAVKRTRWRANSRYLHDDLEATLRRLLDQPDAEA